MWYLLIVVFIPFKLNLITYIVWFMSSILVFFSSILLLVSSGISYLSHFYSLLLFYYSLVASFSLFHFECFHGLLYVMYFLEVTICIF